jgi:hypothetical protein
MTARVQYTVVDYLAARLNTLAFFYLKTWNGYFVFSLSAVLSVPDTAS